MATVFTHDIEARTFAVAGGGEYDHPAIWRPTRLLVLALCLGQSGYLEGLAMQREKIEDIALVAAGEGD